MAKKTTSRKGRSVPSSERPIVFEGFVRHSCGWVNVKGNSFRAGAGCPRCEQPIDHVEKLSPEEISGLRLKKLSGAELDHMVARMKAGAPELEDEDDEEELEDEDDEGDDFDEDDDDDQEDDDEDEEELSSRESTSP